MEKFISYNKLSKKEKKKADRKMRITWEEFGSISPVTRTVKSKKLYSRSKGKESVRQDLKKYG